MSYPSVVGGETTPRTVGPVADLSYRNYDGPLDPPAYRWWAIARMGIQLTFRKKGYWFAAACSAWYYIGMIFVLFIVDQLTAGGAPGGGPNPTDAFFSRIVWKDQFLHGIGFGQMLFLVIVLLTGAGAIANDNRANALLVYLSKPCNKLDYLVGKWFGIFIPLLLAHLAPALLFFAYGALSYRERGFLSNDPYLILKLLLTMPVLAAFQTSLVLGVSSIFKQGRVAGATYAGFYFLTNFFTQVMVIAWNQITWNPEGSPREALALVKNLFYSSIDGINIGLAKGILGTDGSAYFGIPSRATMVPAPSLALMLGVAIVLSGLSLLLAWSKIRAVEVVG